IDVQYSLDQGTTWLPIAQLEDRTCLVLERECGIRFDGLMPPRELLNPPSGFTAMVRVTATMRDDLRLGATVGPDGTSPLAGLAPAFLDESERWHWREVGAKSRFNGVSGLTANTADDTIQINLYAQWLYNVWDLADVCGMIAVEGLDSGFPYDLGQVIVGIAGRQISFNGKSAASGQQSYPQVVAIELDVQNQRQILHLETYRDPGAVTPIRGAALARMQTAVKRSIRQRRR
ncbi:MAG TPA: hypothetical protein VGX76_05055, partial [Pirellulales bacterium]|nr:hypothetical protein [Pirellulales bacterium]